MNIDDYDKIQCTNYEYYRHEGPTMVIENRGCDDLYFKLVPKKNLLSDLPVTHPYNPQHKEGRNFSENLYWCPSCHTLFDRKNQYCDRCYALAAKLDRFKEVDALIDEEWQDDEIGNRVFKQIARAIVKIIEEKQS